MWFNPILLCCECGAPLPGCIKQIGLTPQHQFVICWSCPSCKKKHQTVKPLVDCLLECSRLKDELEGVQPSHDVKREGDVCLMHSLEVRSLEDDDPAQAAPEIFRRSA